MSPAVSDAQVAGTTTVSVRVTELQEVAKGWSVKRSILGQPVYNDKDEQVGSIDDIIISPDKAASYAIVNAGGFLGLTNHDVAIPSRSSRWSIKNWFWLGATKE